MEPNNAVETLVLSSDQIVAEHDKLVDTQKDLDRQVCVSGLVEAALARKISQGSKDSTSPDGYNFQSAMMQDQLSKRANTFIGNATVNRDKHKQKVKEFVSDNLDQLYDIVENEMDSSVHTLK